MMTTERKVSAGLVVGLGLMIALGGAAALSGRHLIQSARLLDHTYEVLRAVEDLHISLLLLETRARGYALSGSENVLEGYESSRDRIQERIREIHALVADNPEQMDRARRVEPILEAKIAFTDALIEARGTEGTDGAARLAAGGEGVQLMADAVAIIQEFEHHERDLLAIRNSAANRGGIRTLSVVVFGWLFAFACATVAGMSIHRDLASRRQAETELQDSHDALALSNAQLVASNQQLEAFSYSVSHDLRVPLRAIDGYARMLAEDYSQVLDSEGHRLLGTVRSSAQDMGRLIDALLQFSRIGRQSLRMDSVDMAQLTREVWNELAVSTNGHQTHLDVADLPLAHGDRSTLRQVMVNLLSNAIKFSAKTDVARISVTSTPNGGDAVYSVRDNGCGFDMRYANKLFKVFQRLHGKDEFDGTGVGLALVQNVIQRHGGRIWAEAELGKGAAFHFTLPTERTGP